MRVTQVTETFPVSHYIMMCGNIHFEGGGRQPSLQPILQEREHDYDRASTGLLPDGRTPIDEQVPLQPVSVSCRWGPLAEVIVFTTVGGRTSASRPGTTLGDSTSHAHLGTRS